MALKIVLLLCLLVLSAANFSFAQTSQMELNANAAHEYDRANAQMNRVYEQIRQKYKEETVFLQKLKKSQRAWIAFRDAHMAACFPLEGDPRMNYGSICLMDYALEMTKLTKDRTKQLSEWLKGTR